MEEKDRRPQLPKATADARKSVRRLVRPRLKTEVQQQDTEMPEAESAGKQIVSSQQDAASEGGLSASAVQQPVRKRQLVPPAADSEEKLSHDGESALKRTRGLDLPEQEGDAQVQTAEPVGGAAAAEEAFDAPPQAEEKDKDASGDIQMEETQTSLDKVDEDQQKEPQPSEETGEENLDSAGNGTGDASGMASSSDMVPMVENQMEQGTDQQQLVEESDKEEGELAPDAADPEEGGGGGGDVPLEAGEEGGEEPEEAAATTPAASPVRVGEDIDAVMEAENNSSLEAVLKDDEKIEEEGEITEEAPAEADAPSGKKIEMEQQQQMSSETATAAAGESGVLPTPPPAQSSPSPGPSLSPSLTTSGSSSTTINLRERAREKAALRQAGALPSATPSRGRVRGRAVRGRGAQTGRGRGQPSSGDSGQGSR